MEQKNRQNISIWVSTDVNTINLFDLSWPKMQCFKTNILMLLMIYFEKFLFGLTNDFLTNFFLKYISARLKKIKFFTTFYIRGVYVPHTL